MENSSSSASMSRPDLGFQVHGTAKAPSIAGLENVPPEPCRWDRLDRPFRGSDDLLPAAIWIAGPPTRSKVHPVARRHCAPECRMERPASHGGMWLGERTTLSHS